MHLALLVDDRQRVEHGPNGLMAGQVAHHRRGHPGAAGLRLAGEHQATTPLGSLVRRVLLGLVGRANQTLDVRTLGAATVVVSPTAGCRHQGKRQEGGRSPSQCAAMPSLLHPLDHEPPRSGRRRKVLLGRFSRRSGSSSGTAG